MKNPKVSFIMGNYNKQGWVAESINDILNQTMKDIELVIVDDCSCDYSMDVIEHYAKKDNRIKVIKNAKNEGISYTYNKATDNSTGDVICVSASDDRYAPNRAKWSFDYLERHKDVDIVYFPFYKAYYDLKPFEIKNAEPFDIKRLKKLDGQFIGHGFMAYTRKVADTVKYRNDQKYGCDHAFLLDCYKAGFKFGWVPYRTNKATNEVDVVKSKIVGTYRFTPNMVSVMHRDYIVEKDVELAKEMENVGNEKTA